MVVLMVLMHHLNADPEVAGGGGTHAERACLESESQMSEESVEGKNFLQMHILHWSGISNVQISFTDFWSATKKRELLSFKQHQSYNNPLHIFSKRALPSL